MSETENTVPSHLTSGLLWLAAVLLVGVVSLVVTSSMAALIFSGPLQRFLPVGLAAGLVGAILVNLTIGAVGRSGALIALPAAATTVILSIAVADLVTGLGPVSDVVFVASAALLLVAASVIMGLVFLAAGWFRLGELARYVPYPVFAGFLGAVGLLIVIGALDLAAQPAGAALLAPVALAYWLPALALGLALWVGTRLWRGRAVLPLAILAALALFHLGRIALGIEAGAAADMGLMILPPDAMALRPLPLTDIAAHADLRAVAAHWPELAVLAVIGLIAATLGASGIELSTGREVDLDRDLRITGLGNLLAAAGGGLASYHNVGSTLLLHRLLGGAGGWAGIGVALVLAGALAGGVEVLALLPRAVSAGVLVYVGLDLIDKWVLSPRRWMPRGDFVILLGIVGVGTSAGFLSGVAVGILAAIGLFIYNYARLDVVRSAADGRLRQSTTERGDADRQAIIACGTGLRIFELQGYVFFGSTQQLLRRLAAEIAEAGDPTRAIILDFRHTQGVDVSAAVALASLARRCATREVRLWLTDTSPELDAMIRRADPAADFRVAPSLDAALAEEEEMVLAGLATRWPQSALTALMARIEAAGHGDLFPQRKVGPGETIYRQGEASDSLVLLEDGRMSAQVVTAEGHALRVATILPGALIGEIGFFGDVARTATVVADTNSLMRVVRRTDIAELTRRDAALGEAFLRCGAALMAQRLARTNAMLRHSYR